jgi:hypothetical protein
MRKMHISVIALLLFIWFVSTVEAKERFIYSKPAFKGRMIDNETKEPIEGVVIVAVYWEGYSFCLNPGGCNPSIAEVAETLTDKKGEFYIKPFTTWMGPFGYTSKIDFIIYKPGYACYPESMGKNLIKPLDIVDQEDLFSKEIGTKGTVTYPEWSGYAKDRKTTTIETTFGIVELPKLKSKEERLRAFPYTPSDCRSKELPLLFKATNEERKTLGLKGEEK